MTVVDSRQTIQETAMKRPATALVCITCSRVRLRLRPSHPICHLDSQIHIESTGRVIRDNKRLLVKINPTSIYNHVVVDILRRHKITVCLDRLGSCQQLIEASCYLASFLTCASGNRTAIMGQVDNVLRPGTRVAVDATCMSGARLTPSLQRMCGPYISLLVHA
jgi:hypothetical protein